MSIKKKGNKNQLRSLDPYLAREQQRYGSTALPSREFIQKVLEDQGTPIDGSTLCKLLNITAKETEFFNRRLTAMIREGQIIRNRKGDICVTNKLDLIKGIVQGHGDGFGFLIVDENGPDLYLSPREMQKVLNGDRVIARKTGKDRRGRLEGEIVEVLERANNELVGRFHTKQGVSFVTAENKRISQEILIPSNATLEAQSGQVVIVKIIQQPEAYSQPIGHVIEILGNHDSPEMEIEIALRKFDLPYLFSEAIEKISAKFPKKVLKKDLTKRQDLRHLPLVTIDGETARDFDDAVYCQMEAENFRLYVAIADVSHYVKDDDALDIEAFNRGNSVYFPRRVIPMLPEVLSNGLCSLNPGVDRLCMVCEMLIEPHGVCLEYQFYPAVMHSHARFTYNEVAAILDDGDQTQAIQHPELHPQIQSLYKAYKALRKERKKRGAIDFETLETQMIFNEQGKIAQIVPVKRNEAHYLIEECMLAANVCASDFLQRHQQPTLYRIHEGPVPEKLEALRNFLKEFGLQLGGGDRPGAKHYAKTLLKIKTRPDVQLLQTVMLQSLQQALYQPENLGHFGLAYESYTHFTSPIRRYPDLLVHRAIKAVLNHATYTPQTNWAELGKHCSMTERRADEATREVETWLKCFYMQDKVGKDFNGVISGVTAFGLFVSLDQIFVEGLVHISELPSDYFHFDNIKHLLIGERTRKIYRLGDKIQVKLARVDLDERKIDFLLSVTKITKQVKKH
ncbi:MAG TPA: ribonuclease R [Nitrosomonas sp.]|nr:ribonuclease R [Nitrosomonas sp.]